MNPDNVKQYQNLLWFGVPKKEQDTIRGMTSTRYVDPSHVMFVELMRGDSDAFVTYSGAGEPVPIKKPIWANGFEQRVIIPTSYLKGVVDNIRSDAVVIKVSDNLPIKLNWKDGEDSWEVVIAPRIENE